MHLRYLSLSFAAMFAAACPAWAVVIVNETFDNYTSEAELHANWRGNAGGPTPGTPAQAEERFELTDLTAPNADFNGDNTIDAADYVVWRNNLNATGPGLQPMGDANGDDVVNELDYVAWKNSYGQAPPVGGGGKAVTHLANPEPRAPDGNLVWNHKLDPIWHDGSIFPTEADPIVLRGDIWVGDGGLQRNTIGLRHEGGANLVEIGFYNTDVRGMGIRVANWQTAGGSTNPEWQFFSVSDELDIDNRQSTSQGGDGNVTWNEVFEHFGPSWHQFEMIITETSVTATVDLLRDGMNNGTGEDGVDATLTFDTGITLSQLGVNSLRIGGPSQLYTTQPAMFDNIFLSGPVTTPEGAGLVVASVPEPATWVLSILAGVVCLAVRHCRHALGV